MLLCKIARGIKDLHFLISPYSLNPILPVEELQCGFFLKTFQNVSLKLSTIVVCSTNLLPLENRQKMLETKTNIHRLQPNSSTISIKLLITI